MKNGEAFYGEESTVAFDPVVSDIIAAIGQRNPPLWYIQAALDCVREFYRTEAEIGLPAERYMPMNEERN